MAPRGFCRHLLAKPPPLVTQAAQPAGTASPAVGRAAAPAWAQPMQPTPEVRGRGCFLPAIACMVWAVLFFIVSGVAVAFMSVRAAGGDEALQQKLSKEWGEKFGPWLLLGSLVLAILLSVIGVLPGTRHPRPPKGD